MDYALIDFAGAPQCSPTRTSVLTGRNNDRTGVFYHGYSLNKNEKTIAQELKKLIFYWSFLSGI